MTGENLYLLPDGQAVNLLFVDFLLLAALLDVRCAYLGTVNLLDGREHFLFEPEWCG